MSEASSDRPDAVVLAGKDARLEILSAVPLVLATPVELLAGTRITDKRDLYVRNIHDYPEAQRIGPMPVEGWEIEVSGRIDPSRVIIRGEDLLAMDQVEYEMVLLCSGNGRNQYEGIPGTPWNQGGVGNVRFTGVPLSAVLKQHDVTIHPEVPFVTAAGAEGPSGRDLPAVEHSLPVADVLETSILALQMNGEPLPGIHGGPVRLITPGFFGTMQIKWLTVLRFETAESTSFYHATEYRVPLAPVHAGERFTFTPENSRPTWYIRLMSHILDPASGAELPAGPVEVRGVAYNDGSARIESVLVSTDRGCTWQRASFEAPESPYAWYQWSIVTELPAGEHEIWARAIDTLGRSQPLDGSVFWNPNGYEWTGVDKARVTVT